MLCLQPPLDKAEKAWLAGEYIDKPPLQVTLPGQECLLTAADVAQMTPLRFKSLWTSYMTELGSCLGTDYSGQAHKARLTDLVWAAMRLKCLHIFGSGPGPLPRPDILNVQADYLIVSLAAGPVVLCLFLASTLLCYS